jgi:opacity protein-like surface antigen
MKKYFSGVTLAALAISSAGLAAGTTAVHAQEMTGTTQASDAAPMQAQEATPTDMTPVYISQHGFYVGAAVGVNFASSLNNTGQDFGTSEDESVNLNPGMSAFVSAGYSFRLSHHLSLATELEVGVMYNSFGNGTGRDGSGNPVSTSGGGDVIQAPLMVNMILNYRITPRWSVYGGFGIGAMYTDVSTSNAALSLLEVEFGSPSFELRAGVQCRLGPGDLGVGYKYVQDTGAFFAVNPINNSVVEASYTVHF